MKPDVQFNCEKEIGSPKKNLNKKAHKVKSRGKPVKKTIEICRLCCKRSNSLTPIYHKTEDTSNNFWNGDNDTVADTDSTSAMLLKLGLNVMIVV